MTVVGAVAGVTVVGAVAGVTVVGVVAVAEVAHYAFDVVAGWLTASVLAGPACNAAPSPR